MASSSMRGDAKQRALSVMLMLASCLTLAPLGSYASADLKIGSKSATDQAKNDKAALVSTDVVRLSKTIMPSSYELTFEPEFENFTYKGKETIALTISAATKEITVNALEMNITSVELEAAAGSGKKFKAKVEMDAKNEQAHFIFDEQIAAGSYKLAVVFDSILNDQLRGFYRSHYKDSSGEQHWICSSQMEPADARRMFPCFDEPEFKATFQINAVIDSKLTAISNAPIDHVIESKDSAKKTVVFDASPKMSTYLMVLVVGDFKSTEMRKSCDVPIRVWAPAGQEKLGEFSLGYACEVMTFLSDYFGIKFPAKKLDLIAIPDFAPGAMENLGAITFKDSLLLIDPKTGSNFAKRGALSVIAHEMAHQWFGDLVTNRWWDDLWLNEAFATWTATKAESALRPDWRTRTKAVIERGSAMQTDQLASTRAIHAHVGNPKQASEMFDAITYDKGSAVLRMLEVYIGENVFQKGVHDYLEAHKFSNATSDDLWTSIGAAASGKPVSQMMRTWIFQPGFPLVSGASKADGKTLTLSQERFFVMPGTSGDSSQWIVPVMTRELSGEAPVSTEVRAAKSAFLLDKKSSDFSLPGAWGDKVVMNAGASGFYRILYSDAALKAKLARFNALSPEERISLISDVGTLAWKGTLPVEDSLELMLKLKGESDSIVGSNLISRFSSPRFYMDEASKPLYENFVCANLAPLKQKLGWEAQPGEEETLKDLRADVIKVLGTSGQDKASIREANEKFNQYLQDKQSVSPDIVGAVVSIVAFNGGEAEYERIKKAWKEAANPQEEKRFLYSLAEFRQPELVNKTLDLAFTADVRSTDTVAMLSMLLSNRDNHDQAWKYTREHWESLAKKFPPRFNKRIAASCGSFDTPEREQELRDFFASHPMESAQSAIARALEEIHVSVLYRQRNEAKIRQWISKQASAL